MIVSEITAKMIQYSGQTLHDINHLMKVYAYAKTIGECEGLDGQTQTILEIAAIVHDIACPLCRQKYGNTNGKYQEAEGPLLVEALLNGTGLSQAQIARIAYLVGHHHTPEAADGPDYQILIEADYLVNADESSYSTKNIENTLETIFKTQTGKTLLTSMYLARQ